MSRKSKSKRTSRVEGNDQKRRVSRRNVYLDALRGLAIVLMLTDHAAEYWYQEQIATSGVRFWTRLSLPLFSVLMGYLLAASPRWNWKRSGQILLASIAVNLIYWPMHHELEILASLLITSVLAKALSSAGPFAKAAAPLLLMSLWIYPIDPIAHWFDYQLTLVGCLVGQGMVLRQFGFPVAIVTGCVLTWLGFEGNLISPNDTHHLVFFFLVPATVSVYLAERFAPSARLVASASPGSFDSDQTSGTKNLSAHDSGTDRGQGDSISDEASHDMPGSDGMPDTVGSPGIVRRVLRTWTEGMAWIGQSPLIIYVVHYYLVVGIGRVISGAH